MSDSAAITPFQQASADMDLRDVLDLVKKEISLSLTCHHVGVIESFDPDRQVASASIPYKKAYYTLDASTKQYVQTLVDYPVLVDMPVIFLGGGNGALTFPVASGDECLILFNDRDINNWYSGVYDQAPMTTRRHAFSDGIILVGLRSSNFLLDNLDTARTVLRNTAGTTGVGIGDTQIKIFNAETTLGIILTQLMTALTTFNTALGTAATAFGGSPLTEPAAAAGGADLATAATALQTEVTAINTLIGELLE